jgi:hypothetical protein
MYAYSPSNNSAPTWAGFEIASSQANLHPWELCLITAPQSIGNEPTVKQVDLRDIQLLNNLPLTARYFAYKSLASNTTQVILYWYNESVYKTDSGYQKKWSMTSIIGYTSDPNNYKSVESAILPIAQSVAEYQQPINTWSWLALAIGENSTPLISVIGGILLGGAIFWIYNRYRDKNNFKTMMSHVSGPEEIHILEALRSLKHNTANGSSIQQRYEELSGKTIDIDRLQQKLLEAQKVGLIIQDFDNDVTEPHFIWKTTY